MMSKQRQGDLPSLSLLLLVTVTSLHQSQARPDQARTGTEKQAQLAVSK
jgi:hypothetical protein